MQRQKYKRTQIKGLIIVLTIAALLVMTSIVLAQSGGDYTLSWWTVDNGGGASNGGDYAVSGTLSQPDAGALMSGGQFTLQGGFWPTSDVSPGPPSGDQQVYLPLIMR